MRRVRALWAALAMPLLAAVIGCAATNQERHPAVIAPEIDLTRSGDGIARGRVALITVAAAGTSSMTSSFKVRRDRSEASAQWLHAAATESLAARGIVLSRSRIHTAHGYFDSLTHFQSIDVWPYDGGSFARGPRFESFYCMDDSLLRSAPIVADWTRVLSRLCGLRKDRGMRLAVPDPARMSEALGADEVLLVVARQTSVTSARKISEGFFFSILSLGYFPFYHERPSSVLSAYLIDLKNARFIWADGCRIDGADGAALEAGWSKLLERWF